MNRGYGTCDVCNKRNEGVLYYDVKNEPIFFKCRECDPDSYLEANMSNQFFTSDVSESNPGVCPIDHFWFGREKKRLIGLECACNQYWVYNGISPIGAKDCSAVLKFDSLSDALAKMAELMKEHENAQ